MTVSGGIRFVALWGALSGAAMAGTLEEVLAVPSELVVKMQEVFIEAQENGERWARFRYLVPALDNFDVVEADFPYICATYALPLLAEAKEEVDQVIISMASAQSDFGVSDPEVTQFFEAFRVENGSCIWEVF